MSPLLFQVIEDGETATRLPSGLLLNPSRLLQNFLYENPLCSQKCTLRDAFFNFTKLPKGLRLHQLRFKPPDTSWMSVVYGGHVITCIVCKSFQKRWSTWHAFITTRHGTIRCDTLAIWNSVVLKKCCGMLRGQDFMLWV